MTMPYIDTEYVYPRNDSIFYLYEYSFAVNSGKTLKSLTLPNNRHPNRKLHCLVSSTETIETLAAASSCISRAVATATYTFPPPNFSVTGTAMKVTPGATMGNTSTISLTLLDGFTGVISLSCAITPIAVSDAATCTIPASVTISGSSAQTVVLTVDTTAVTSALN